MKKNILLILIPLSILSCNRNNNNYAEQSIPTAGSLIIGVDESLKPFAEAEIQSFKNLYPQADIQALFLPEKEVIDQLKSNKIQTGIICRELNFDEIKVIQDTFALYPSMVKLATDAIVMTVNESNKTTSISNVELIQILSGKISSWDQLSNGLKQKKPIIVVTTKASSVNRYASYLNDTVGLINSFALDSTAQVIDYIRQNPYSLGILGGSWFYQKGDKYNDIKIVPYQANDESEKDESTLNREVFVVTQEPFNGLAYGFIAFMVSQKGQLIISKAGMTPYRAIYREIELSR